MMGIDDEIVLMTRWRVPMEMTVRLSALVAGVLVRVMRTMRVRVFVQRLAVFVYK